jgi:hypothetical protein
VSLESLECIEAGGFNLDLGRKYHPEQGLTHGAAAMVSLA